MSKENPTFCDYQNFVQDAISSGAHIREGLTPQRQKVWDETVNTVVVSAFSEIPIEDLKENFGIGKAAVSLRRRRGVQELLEGMPSELGVQYSTEILSSSYTKRPFPQVVSERRSRGRGGKSGIVMEFLRSNPDMTTAQALDHFQLEGHQRQQVKRKLAQWGRTDVPNESGVRSEDVIKAIQSATTYEQKQKALNMVKKSFMEKNIRGDSSILIPLIAEIQKMGFRVHYRYGGSELYFEVLRAGEIAFAQINLTEVNKNQKYSVGLRCDLSDVERVLSSSPRTACFRVNKSR